MAQVVVVVLTDPTLRGGVVDVGGPENVTNMDVVRLYEEQAGRPAKVSHVPLPALQVLYRLLRPFHPWLSGVLRISILVDRTDQTFDPSAALERFPIRLKRLEDFVQRRTASA